MVTEILGWLKNQAVETDRNKEGCVFKVTVKIPPWSWSVKNITTATDKHQMQPFATKATFSVVLLLKDKWTLPLLSLLLLFVEKLCQHKYDFISLAFWYLATKSKSKAGRYNFPHVHYSCIFTAWETWAKNIMSFWL